MPHKEDRAYSITEFGDLPFITLHKRESTCTGDMIRSLFRSAGMDPPIREAGTMREQIEKVEMGEGLILINPGNYICYSPNVHCVNVKELKPQSPS